MYKTLGNARMHLCLPVQQRMCWFSTREWCLAVWLADWCAVICSIEDCMQAANTSKPNDDVIRQY